MNRSLARCKARTPQTAATEIRRDPGYGSITKSATQTSSVILATSSKGRYDNVARSGAMMASLFAIIKSQNDDGVVGVGESNL